MTRGNGPAHGLEQSLHDRGRLRRGLVVLVAVMVIGNWPVTTRYGVTYQWFQKRIPLYEKAINFLSRHLQTRRLAREVAGGVTGDDAKLFTIFSWVKEHVQPTPQGFPVVDDHVWDIFVRGYGAADQRSEAFAALASYSGFRAGVVALSVPEARSNLLLAFVQRHGKSLVFDIQRQLVFKNEAGALASVEDLIRNPALVTRVVGELTIDGIPYERFIAQLSGARVEYGRIGGQQPWVRFRNEFLRLLSDRT